MRWIVLPSAGLTVASLLLAAGCTATSSGFSALDGGDGGASASGNDAGAGKSDGGKAAAAKSDGTLCGDMCANAAKADCAKQSSCQTECEDTEAKIPSGCTSAFEAAMKCAAEDPLSGCDSKGKVKLAGCKDESVALLSCLQGGGTKDSGTTSSCTLQLTFGDTTCDGCVQSNCCLQANACAGSSECMAIADCAANCATQACVTTCRNAHPTGAAKDTALTSCLTSACSAVCSK